ncbi:MAG: ubiquinol-cytochrome c reductase iron-sulfur subunit [Candidatus Actinomarina sp.]|jgi:cytochrome b6-f complex iron-sulfur subunit|tara:strand:- start:533 stop:1411 length:879 start_codon:yes stop_codon:yes gene_type:complete
MSLVQLSFIAIAFIGLFGVIGIIAVVTGRTPKAVNKKLNWKKNLDKRALKADKSNTNFLAPDEPENEEENLSEDIEQKEDIQTDGSIKVKEEIIYEEISEEEAGMTRRQFLGKALGITFGAFAGIQLISWLGFFYPKVSGGFGSKIDAGRVQDLKDQIFQSDGSVIPAFIPSARAYVLPFEESGTSQFSDSGTVADGLVAVYQRCVHLGCRVPWCNTSQGFECPCHGSKYNMVGEYYAGPAPRNLDRFIVNVNTSGKFIIDTGSIIESPRAAGMSVKYPQGISCITIAAPEE